MNILIPFIAIIILSCSSDKTGYSEDNNLEGLNINNLIEPVDISVIDTSVISIPKLDTNKNNFHFDDMSIYFNGELEYRRENTIDTIYIDGELYYITEGDLLLSASEQLNLIYNEFNLGIRPELVMPYFDNRIWRWKKKTAVFSICKSAFKNESRYEIIKNNFIKASKEWEALTGITFSHLSVHDNLKNNQLKKLVKNDKIDFYVTYSKKLSIKNFIAFSFFPFQKKGVRSVKITNNYFTDSEYDKVGIIRHEIGHIMGFAHEHNRDEAPKECRRDFSSEYLRLLSDRYDSNSLMHYFCGRMGTKKLMFSATDSLGICEIYNSEACE